VYSDAKSKHTTHLLSTILYYFVHGLLLLSFNQKDNSVTGEFSKILVAVASARPYANLHLIPNSQLRQHPTTQFFIGQMRFLLPNQQRQST